MSASTKEQCPCDLISKSKVLTPNLYSFARQRIPLPLSIHFVIYLSIHFVFMEAVVKPGKYSYLSVPGTKPLSEKTVGQVLDSTVQKFGSLEALYVKSTDDRLTFSDVKQESDRLAAGFLQIGFKPGDRVGLWGPNSRQWYITSFALAKAGIISVYLNPAYQIPELLTCITHVGMKGIVISGQFKTQNYFLMLAKVIPDLPVSQAGQLRSEQVPTLTTVVSMESTPPGSGVYAYDDIVQLGTGKEALERLELISNMINFDDVCNIQFTSGTTGRPKGVMLTHHNIVNNSLLVGKRYQLSSSDRICLPLPMFHTGGSVLGALAAVHYGSTLIFPSPGYDPVTAVKVAAEERCTLIAGTPTMHLDMLNAMSLEALDLSALRTAYVGGSTCSYELIKRMKKEYNLRRISVVYGMTETSPSSVQSLPSDSDELQALTVGYPQEHTEIKIVDRNGRIVPVGTPGELCVRGYLTMKGYWGEPVKTREVLDATRWLHTGDICTMEPSGHVSFVSRNKDVIIRGGENIYPREIEDFLVTLPGILETHVFGVPNVRLGEVVAAWISLKDGIRMTAEEVRKACKGQISHFKIPQYIHFTSDFPRTPLGKVQKFCIRELEVKRLGLQG